MLGIDLVSPGWLLALALVPLALWLGLRARAPRGARARIALLLRAALLALIVLALARPRGSRPVTAWSTAFLVDVSDSVPAAERARAEAFVERAIAAMGADDRAAVVAFGEEALVDRAAREGRFEALRSAPGSGRTDVAAALRIGSTMLPSDAGRRLVLLSDGKANAGDDVEEAERAAAAGLPVDVLPLASAGSAEEVQLAGLEAPAHARVGQRFDVVPVIRAARGGPARLQVLRGAELVYDEALDLPPGESRFPVSVEVEEAGFERFRALLLPERDGWPQNNEAAAYTQVAGPPRVLVAAEEAARARPLVDALEAAGRRPEIVSPSGVPDSLIGLADYDSVVLVDLPARLLRRESQEAIAASVRELGQGLVMIGGEDSFGAGGYRHSPIEKALPVEMEVRDKETRPDLAIAFVIDKSGSMSSAGSGGPGGPGGGSAKLALAKEAVQQAGTLLQPRDLAAVVAFDDAAEEVWGPSPQEDAGPFLRAVGGIQAGGGTNIHAGLDRAVSMLEREEVPLKHVLLLSDGWSSDSGYEGLLQRMDAAGITLSIVAIGEGSAPFLTDLAGRGGGRYYPVSRPEAIPQVFVEETLTTMGTYVIEERFQPAPGSRSDILSGLDPEALPPLNGYNGTTAKDSATVALWSHLEDPVLAQWQHGLGRAVAWTSDAMDRWAADWVADPRFGDFAVQLVDWTLPAPDDEGLQPEITLAGAEARIALEARDDEGAELNFLEIEARLTGPDGDSFTLPLSQTGAGRYEGRADLPDEGVYLVRIDARREGRSLGTRRAGLVLPYSPEYADPTRLATDPRLLRLAEATGGRVLETPEQAFDGLARASTAVEMWPLLLLLAVLLLPLDVAARRLKIRRDDVTRAAAGLRDRLRSGRAGRAARGGAQPEKSLGSLLAARDRARARSEAGLSPPRGGAAEASGPGGSGEEGGAGGPREDAGQDDVPGGAADAKDGAPKDAAGAEGIDVPRDRLARLRAAKRRAREQR